MKHILALSLFALAGCASLPGTPAIDMVDPAGWRATATADDRARVRDWRKTFLDAREEAQDAGYGSDLDALGVLGQPDAAMLYTPPPPGTYRCRTVKLGTQGRAALAFVAYPFFTCRVAPQGDLTLFAKLTGSQRPVGLLFDDDAYRQVFIGTLSLGDENSATRYATDPQRDMIGLMQKIGNRQWRLLLPEPRYESRLDIIEILPLED